MTFFIGFSKRIRVKTSSREMEADPYSNRTRDKPPGPVQADGLRRPGEAVVMKERGMQPQYGREKANAIKETLRKTVPSGL